MRIEGFILISPPIVVHLPQKTTAAATTNHHSTRPPRLLHPHHLLRDARVMVVVAGAVGVCVLARALSINIGY